MTKKNNNKRNRFTKGDRHELQVMVDKANRAAKAGGGARAPKKASQATNNKVASIKKKLLYQYMYGSYPGPHVTAACPPITTRACMRRTARDVFTAQTGAQGHLALYFNPSWIGFNAVKFEQVNNVSTLEDFTWGTMATSSPPNGTANMQSTSTGRYISGQVGNLTQPYAGYVRTERVHVSFRYMGTNLNKGGVGYVRTGKDERSINTWSSAGETVTTQGFDEAFQYPLAAPVTLDQHGNVSYTFHPGVDRDWLEVKRFTGYEETRNSIIDAENLQCKDGWTSALGIISATAAQTYEITITVDYLVSNLCTAGPGTNEASSFPNSTVAHSSPLQRTAVEGSVSSHRLALTNGANANTSIVKTAADSLVSGVVDATKGLPAKLAGKAGSSIGSAIENMAMGLIGS